MLLPCILLFCYTQVGELRAGKKVHARLALARSSSLGPARSDKKKAFWADNL